MRRRLLTVGHSYSVALNRRLADAMARVAEDRWEVTAIAPKWLAGEFRPIPFESNPNERNHTEVVPVYFSQRAHHLLYGGATRRIIQSQKWDLVHCWQEPFVLSAAQVGWWSKPTPIVYFTYQNLSKWYPPPFSWCEKWCLARCAGWIAAGETIYKVLMDRPAYKKRPCQIIGSGVDTKVFRPDLAAKEAIRQKLGWQSGPPILGYLGRFVPEKGLRLLCDSLDQLKCPWRVLLVGGGPLEAQLRQWANKHGDRVRIVTTVTHSEVPAYLNAMDILAAPSQTTNHWREQFGRMLVEAFACGLPVVGSDSGEIPYVIGDAGRLVPEADQAAWQQVLEELLESASLRMELGQRGRTRAMERFDWDVIARKHWEFFEKLLESPGIRTEPNSI